MPDVNDPNHEPQNFADLPMQPTGSGPADLEVAYEQMRLVEEAEGAAGITASEDSIIAAVPTEETPDADASAAHPS